jgi:hypothetical protein
MSAKCLSLSQVVTRIVRGTMRAVGSVRWFAVAFSPLLLCVVLLVPGEAAAAGQASQNEPGDVPAARVTMEFGQGAFILSAAGGKGTLTFKGRRYAFKVGGLGIGGLGVSKITASGEVFNLKRIEDFPGAFFQARAGYAAIKGKGVQWLENSNGVIMKLRSTSRGVSLNLGADGLVIEMGYIKKK